MGIEKQGIKKQEQQTCSTAKKRASRKPNEATPTDGDGLERVRSAAERELAQRGQQIIKALGDKAAGGDVSSFKALMTEAAKAENKKAKRGRGKTMTQELAGGPQWEGRPAKTGEEFEDWNGDPDAGAGSARTR